MKYFMSTMNKKLKKLIHTKYDTIAINEYNIIKKYCNCNILNLYYNYKEDKKVFRLY